MEVKLWALIPIAIVSGLFVLLYWWMWKTGRRILANAIASIEKQQNITVSYGVREIKINGRVTPTRRILLGLLVFLLHFATMFLPLLLTGCAVFLLDALIPAAVIDAIRK